VNCVFGFGDFSLFLVTFCCFWVFLWLFPQCWLASLHEWAVFVLKNLAANMRMLISGNDDDFL